jgi:hypothetical protein
MRVYSKWQLRKSCQKGGLSKYVNENSGLRNDWVDQNNQKDGAKGDLERTIRVLASSRT